LEIVRCKNTFNDVYGENVLGERTGDYVLVDRPVGGVEQSRTEWNTADTEQRIFDAWID